MGEPYHKLKQASLKKQFQRKQQGSTGNFQRAQVAALPVYHYESKPSSHLHRSQR